MEDSALVEASGASEAIRHLKEAIACGKNWHVALLEAIGLWDKTEEVHRGRNYRYLVGGEAFDWLVLAERLCEEVDGLVSDREKEALLFFGKLPEEIDKETFRALIGRPKYRAHLNYFYGVLVEEALHLAVEEEVRKEWGSSLYPGARRPVEDEVYERIYGASQGELLRRFRAEKGRPHLDSITLEETKEFTYWLFKYRLKKCDRARVASDTRKGLDQLQRLRQLKGLPGSLPL